jgi:hypothetical protein
VDRSNNFSQLELEINSILPFLMFIGPPDPPKNCDVHNHTTQGLSVTCSRGFGGGLEQTFHMEVRDRDTGHLLQNLSNMDPIFTVG